MPRRNLAQLESLVGRRVRVHAGVFNAAWNTAAGRQIGGVEEFLEGEILSYFPGGTAAQDCWALRYADGDETGPGKPGGPHPKQKFIKKWLVGEWAGTRAHLKAVR